MTVSKTWSTPWTTANFSVQEQHSLLCLCALHRNTLTFNAETLKGWKSVAIPWDSFGGLMETQEFHSRQHNLAVPLPGEFPNPGTFFYPPSLISGRVSEIQDTMDGWGCFKETFVPNVSPPRNTSCICSQQHERFRMCGEQDKCGLA